MGIQDLGTGRLGDRGTERRKVETEKRRNGDTGIQRYVLIIQSVKFV